MTDHTTRFLLQSPFVLLKTIRLFSVITTIHGIQLAAYNTMILRWYCNQYVRNWRSLYPCVFAPLFIWN